MRPTISRAVLALTSVISLAPSVLGLEIPKPTGPYYVGKKKLEIPFLDTHAIYNPGNVSKSFIATLFYPTLQTPPPGPGLPYLEPEFAAIIEGYFNLTAGIIANITSHTQADAPFAHPLGSGHGDETNKFPTLVFQPSGYGPPVDGFSDFIPELVSRGYVVAGLDHPYEQPFVRYPNGTGLYGLPLDYSLTSQEEFNAFAQFRVRDNEHFVKVWPEIVATLEAPWATTNLGLFGHSIGGAAAAGAALLFDSETVASSLNIDGTYGDTAIDPATGDLKRPALSLGGSYRIDAPEATYDPTWDMFGAVQTGWFRTLLVEGATHNDFDDYNFWKTLGIDGLGPIPSARAINVTREFITAFFNYTLLGQQEDILTVPGPEWPEVFVYDRSEDA